MCHIYDIQCMDFVCIDFIMYILGTLCLIKVYFDHYCIFRPSQSSCIKIIFCAQLN